MSKLLCSLLCCCVLSLHAAAPLRIMSWEGYVTPSDIARLNLLLDKAGYPHDVTVISPLAENAAQLYEQLRLDRCDIAFVTLFFLKMEHQQLTRVLQPINVDSPRLSNYAFLLPGLQRIPMGMQGDRPLYIPWGGGAYGFYIDADRIKSADFPGSVADLWLPRWAGKYSLNAAQEWYNVGLSLMSLGYSPFHLQQLVMAGQREQAIALAHADGPLQRQLTALYRNSGHLWQSVSRAAPGLEIISSWGPEIDALNQQGGNWQRLQFSEGNMFWLDALAFNRTLTGRRLEAAELIANYFISQQVQLRITRQLSMKAASTLGYRQDEDFRWLQAVDRQSVVPPYDAATHGIMKRLLNRAHEAAGVKQTSTPP